MPMFSRRDTVDGASLVCSVESTRWPVSAALTAISAVSKSRISPTMMMFGSCRKNARRAVAKLRPMSSCICTWLMPCRLNSTGSSAVEMLRSIVLSSDSAEYSVVVLPEPVGPVTSTMPYGFLIAYLKSSSGLMSKPSFVMSSCSVRLVEETHDDLLAEQRRQDADAEVHLAVAADLELDAAVLRQAALGDVERGHDLEARRDRVAQLERRPHLLLEDAVDAEPHAEALLVRLDVDIRRLLLDRRQQDRVAELDDRRLAGLVLEVDDVDVLVGDRGVVDVVDVEARRPSGRGRGPCRSSATAPPRCRPRTRRPARCCTG